MKPEIFDPIFGLLKLDTSYPQYDGFVLFSPEELIEVCFNCDEIEGKVDDLTDEDVKSTLTKAHQVYLAFWEKEPELRQSVAERSYKGDWIAPEGKTDGTFTFEDFMSHVKLNRIYFHAHQIFSVVYDFGDLFGGFMCDDYVDENFNLR